MVLDMDMCVKHLRALGHPLRLQIIMTLIPGDMYLSEIARKIGISRALAKIHLTKLVKAGLVDTRVVLLEEEARARRYYTLLPFDIHISPDLLAQEVECIEL
jgi:predicted transcriptional regulator